MVQVNIALHAKYILSNPDKEWNDMGIISIEVNANKLSIDDVAETAAEGGWFGSPVIMNDDQTGVFRATLELEQDSIYKLRVTVRTATDSKTHKNFYINTADSTSLYALDANLVSVDSTGSNPAVLAGATFTLTPGASVEFPKYLEGIIKGGVPITLDGQTGATDAEKLYQYVKVKETGVTFEATSNARGLVAFQHLPSSSYGIDITAAGHTAFTSSMVIYRDQASTFQLKRV